MKIKLIDFIIIAAYLAFTIVIGLILKNRAQKDKSSYLLGSNRLPWYMLGLSNASGMFDISGTMWLVTLMFVYGLKSIWIPWLWPVFNQIFLMVYLSAWLRRSNVTTGAEWIGTRFGFGRGAELSHNVVVAFALISCLGFLAYGFIGLGKFIEIFIPWEIVSEYIPLNIKPEYVPHLYGIAFTAFAVFYAILGGMMSIVWADLIQYIIMTITSIVIGIIAMNALTDHALVVPEGWHSPFFGWKLGIDWQGIIAEVNEKIRTDGYSLFSLFFGVMLFKGILISAAGPAPNYDMQKILATKNPKEAAMMSGFVSVILNPIRYFLITGFAVLAILFYNQLDLIVAGKIDFEQILPSAINEFAPIGILGLLLAGLLAAFNSTFAGTLNAAQAYLINDIFLKYIRPNATGRQVKTINYTAGLIVVAISIIFGIFSKNVNSVLQWIVSGLWGGYTAANVLKWYWWRFNGHGFFWGMATGIAAALIFPKFLPPLFPAIPQDIILLYFFPALLLISVIGCIAGTYMAPPTEEETLKKFYLTVRPWGFWKPIHNKIVAEIPDFTENKNFGRDMFNIFVGIICQTALIALPIFIIIRAHASLIITIALIAITGVVLKKTWYDRLEQV
ncbi:MAG: sodium:solute symporter [Bacteroides sp. SM23_62_1]|nr:MAG: sodium:solute symporter [Bacteroides sp. SM23_62_1]